MRALTRAPLRSQSGHAPGRTHDAWPELHARNSMHEAHTHAHTRISRHMRTHCLWDQGEWFVIYNKDTALLTEYSDQRV